MVDMVLANSNVKKWMQRVFYAFLLFVCIVIYTLFQGRGSSGMNPHDAARLRDMGTISASLETYARAHEGMFPESLDVLVKEGYLNKTLFDPVTRKPYYYLLSGAGNYSVCAFLEDHSQRCVSTNAKKLGF